MPLQWRNQFWQSLEEGAGKRCSECGEQNDRADRLARRATPTNGLLLGGSEVLRSLRHYLQAQRQEHHTIDRLEERGVERGSAGRERPSSINKHWNRFKSEDGEIIFLFFFSFCLLKCAVPKAESRMGPWNKRERKKSHPARC